MDSKSLYQGHHIFRNQPSYTYFNKSFEEAKDVLFLQIEEINANFMTDAQLKNDAGFSRNILVDPRTKKEQLIIEYDHSLRGKKQKLFKGGGIKSALTKEQHKVGLRVLLAQQERKEIDEADLIIWHNIQTKLHKERSQMEEYVREFEETYKADIYALTERLEELYKTWFAKKRDLYVKLMPDNQAFNTHTGLPLVNLCKTINDDFIEIAYVELLSKRGYVRLYQDDQQVDWQNLNFRLHEFANCFNNSQEVVENPELTKKINAELESIDEKSTGQSFFIPLKTLLFLFTTGDMDLPTEVLLDISNADGVMDGKIIVFDRPLPAHNCGYHTHQQVVEQCFAAFISAKGRANWLKVDQNEVYIEKINVNEISVGGIDLSQYAPVVFEHYLAKNEKNFKHHLLYDVKQNNALLKWYLKSPDLENGLKILTTLKLPPATSDRGDKFLACEFIKLESKPQFGCEIFAKYELLSAWFQMRLMKFTKTTDYGICYRLSTSDLSLQLKQRFTLEEIEQSLKEHYRINPNQLMVNLAEFLKLLCKMPTGKYMLRYNPKYSDKFLLCSTSQEITQNTIFLHDLIKAEPTNLAWMTQKHLPISETLCSAVHINNKILPCAFLPLLPGQKHLETPEKKMKRRKIFISKIANQNTKKFKEKQVKASKKAQKRKRRKLRSKGSKKAKEAAVEDNDYVVK